MKNHLVPADFDPADDASMVVSYVQCTVFGVHWAPVSSVVAAPQFR